MKIQWKHGTRNHNHADPLIGILVIAAFFRVLEPQLNLPKIKFYSPKCSPMIK